MLFPFASRQLVVAKYPASFRQLGEQLIQLSVCTGTRHEQLLSVVFKSIEHLLQIVCPTSREQNLASVSAPFDDFFASFDQHGMVDAKELLESSFVNVAQEAAKCIVVRRRGVVALPKGLFISFASHNIQVFTSLIAKISAYAKSGIIPLKSVLQLRGKAIAEILDRPQRRTFARLFGP